MKTVNLKSLTTIFKYYKKEDPDIKCLKFWNREIKRTDLESLNILLQNIYENEPGINISNFNDFYIGYTIPQIGKEFDLLRFTNKSILNIELKLLRNYHYLLAYLKNSLLLNISSYIVIIKDQILLYLILGLLMVNMLFLHIA